MSYTFIDHSPEVLAALELQVKKGLTTCGLVAEGYAKAECPVDTGNLRNSITHAVEGNDAYIGTNVEYAVYVEMGTGRRGGWSQDIAGQAAQPYIRPAIENHMSEYEDILENALKA